MIYLASPYSHPEESVRHERFRLACAAAGSLMREGIHVFSPIAHTRPIALISELPLGWYYWEAFDRKMIAACDAMLVLVIDGWQESRGVAAERAIAVELGKPVGFLSVEGDGTVFKQSKLE